MYLFDGTSPREMSESEVSEYANSLLEHTEPSPSPQEQTMTLARTMAAAATGLTDAVSLSIPDLLPTWEELLSAGQPIQPGVCLMHKGQCYRQVQSGAVTPIESQPPDMKGMLAVYRPIEREHTGALSDPIPWVSGMDCRTGKYYSYEGVTYLCKGDMIPCVWTPGTAGLWQWEVVS